VVDHARGSVTCVGDDPVHIGSLIEAARSRPAVLSTLGQLRVEVLDDDLDDHADRIIEVLRLISEGDLYQVNVARRLTLHVKGEPIDLFIKTMNNSPTSYCCYIDFNKTSVLSTSPEVFLDARRDGTVVTRPIKGTRRRGTNAQEDDQLRRDLDGDEKERAELAMVIDLERNDLGRIAMPGSVHVELPPRIETHNTLHHRVADVSARLANGTTWSELVSATFPSGSVTGTPKVRAMEVISRVERHRRGLYTGAIGYVGRDGRLLLSMAIRTLTIHGEEGHYHVGGGIVADSDPLREVEETRVKTLHLTRALEELVSER
jgi:anthranilate/para-aminobenzoate synthase component I